jgi:hypothetical protein
MMNRFDEIKSKLEFSKNRNVSPQALEEQQVSFKNSVTDALMFRHSFSEPDYFPVIVRVDGIICRIVDTSHDGHSIVVAVPEDEQEKVWQMIKSHFPKLNA